MAEERFYRDNKKLAGRLGVSIITWRRWIYQGRVKAVETTGWRYRMPESEILRILGKKKEETIAQERGSRCRQVLPYERVKGGLLKRQLERKVDAIIVENKDRLTGFGFSYYPAKFRGSHEPELKLSLTMSGRRMPCKSWSRI